MTDMNEKNKNIKENKDIDENKDKEMLNTIKQLQEMGLGSLVYKALRKECMHCDSCKAMTDIIANKGYTDVHDMLGDMQLGKDLDTYMNKCWHCAKLRQYGLYKAYITFGVLCTLSTGKKTVVVRKYGKRVHELREKGYKRGKIADMLKISLSSVDKCLREWNEELEESFNKKKDTEPRVVNVNGKEKRFNFWMNFGEEYKRLKAEGLKDGEIAKKYGVSAGTLSRHKQRYKWDK